MDSALPRHTDIRNDDVEDVRFQFALGGLPAVHHFNPVTFLAKGNLQQVADRFLIVDNEYVGHFSQRSLDCGFCCVRGASRKSRQFDDKLSTAVFLGYHANLSTVSLDNLIADGKPQPGAALETRLQRLKNLGPLLWVEADTRVLKGDAQPERALFQLHGQGAAIGHRPDRVVTEIPEDLPDFVRIHAGVQFLSVKCADNLILGAYLRFLLHEHQRFIEEAANIGMLKFVGLLSRIVEKVRDDIVEPLGFPTHNIDKMLLVFLERYEARQFLNRAGHGRQRLPNFVRDGGGKPPQGSHALLGSYFLLQPAKIREVLKIENVAIALRVARTERRNTDAQIADATGRRSEVNLLSEGEPLAIFVLTGEPEILIQFLQLLAAQFSEEMSADFLAGAIQQQNASVEFLRD